MDARATGFFPSQVEGRDHVSVSGYKRELDILYLLFSSIWGYTNGAAIGNALIKNSVWHILTITALPINWNIFPFKPHDGFSDPSMQQVEKICRLATYILSPLAGGVFSWFLNRNEDRSEFTFFIEQFVILSANFLATYLLHNRPSFTKKMDCCGVVIGCCDVVMMGCWGVAKSVGHWFIKKGRDLFNYFTASKENGPQSSKQEALKQILRKRIRVLRAENQKTALEIKALKDFIESRPTVLESFQSCLKETRHLLMDFPEPDDSDPLENPLEEEWRKETQKKDDFDYLKIYFREFLRKNPRFCEVLKEALKEDPTHHRQLQAAIEWKS